MFGMLHMGKSFQDLISVQRNGNTNTSSMAYSSPSQNNRQNSPSCSEFVANSPPSLDEVSLNNNNARIIILS